MFSGTKSRVMADKDHAQSEKSEMGEPLATMFDKGGNGGAIDLSSREIGDDGNYYECVMCDNVGDLLCCDTCPSAFHLQCLIPPLLHAPAGSWQCQRCCEIYDLIGPIKTRLSSSSTPDSSYSTWEQPTGEELDAAEILANRMSCSCSSIECQVDYKNLPNEDLVTDQEQSRRWKGRFFKRSKLKTCMTDTSVLFNCSSTQTESDMQVDGDLKNDASCSDMEEAKATQKQVRVLAPQLVDRDGLVDVPQVLDDVQFPVSRAIVPLAVDNGAFSKDRIHETRQKTRNRRNDMVDIWFEDELDALWIGVRWYGPGNWQMMLEDPHLRLSKFKTPEDLSLRWEIEKQKVLDIENDQPHYSPLKRPPPRRLLHSAASATSSSRVGRTRGILKSPRPTTSSKKKHSSCGKLKVTRKLLDDESQTATSLQPPRMVAKP